MRGRAAGLKAALEILGFVAGRWTSGQLLARGEILAAALTPAVALAAALVWTGLAAGEGRRPTGPVSSVRPGWLTALRSTFQVDWNAVSGLRAWWVNRFLFWGAFIALNTFLLFYLVDVAGMDEPDAQRFVANVSGVLGAAILLVTIPAGWITDRVGRRWMVSATGVLAAAGTAGLLAARSQAGMLAAGAVLGVGIGAFLSADWALLTDLVPRAAAGRYLGLANMAAAGGSAAARFLGGSMIDPINRLAGSTTAGYVFVYTTALAAFLAAALAILAVPEPKHLAEAGTHRPP
jgi:MFS family permease